MSSISTIQTKLKVRRGDTVRVLRGKDRGKKAVVMAALPQEGRLLVEGVNMVKKHVRPKRSGEKGQRVTIASPIPVSNVQLYCAECKRGVRVGIRRGADRKAERICRNCEAVIPYPKQ